MRLFIILILTLVGTPVLAQKLSVVAIGEAKLERSPITFLLTEIEGTLSTPERKKLEEILQIFHNDFSFYRKNFQVNSVIDELK